MIPQPLATELLAKCGRCCCLCRRFKPLHLHIHHIVEKSDGGTDEEDNLIPLCLTCHSDTHTQTKLTRRFTADELKQHRDLVYRLVAEGKLPAGEPVADPLAAFSALSAVEAVFPSSDTETRLSKIAVDILVAASQGNGYIHMSLSNHGFSVQAGNQSLCHQVKDGRTEAEFRHSMSELEDAELIEPRGDQGQVFFLTHRGYLLADELIAAGASV